MRCGGDLQPCHPSTARIFLGHYLPPRPWDKPLYPTTWKLFRSYISNTHTEQAVREIYDGLVCDSGRVYCEMAFPWLDRAKAATVDFAVIATPVLAMEANRRTANPRGLAHHRHEVSAGYLRRDSAVRPPRLCRRVASVTMTRIDDWMARNHVLSAVSGTTAAARSPVGAEAAPQRQVDPDQRVRLRSGQREVSSACACHGLEAQLRTTGAT